MKATKLFALLVVLFAGMSAFATCATPSTVNLASSALGAGVAGVTGGGVSGCVSVLTNLTGSLINASSTTSNYEYLVVYMGSCVGTTQFKLYQAVTSATGSQSTYIMPSGASITIASGQSFCVEYGGLRAGLANR